MCWWWLLLFASCLKSNAPSDGNLDVNNWKSVQIRPLRCNSFSKNLLRADAEKRACNSTCSCEKGVLVMLFFSPTFFLHSSPRQIGKHGVFSDTWSDKPTNLCGCCFRGKFAFGGRRPARHGPRARHSQSATFILGRGWTRSAASHGPIKLPSKDSSIKWIKSRNSEFLTAWNG